MLVNTPEKEDEIKWKKNFASNLNDLIFEKKININKLSGIIGIDPKTLRNYCDAKSIPTAINLMKIAEYFNVTTDSLISCKVPDVGYCDRTIIELGSLIKDFDAYVDMKNCDNESVTITFNDKIISMIIRELYLSKKRDDYPEITAKLAKSYGNMKIYKNHLIDFLTFQNIMEHEYIYNGLEEYIHEYILLDTGKPCLGYDGYTAEEIDKRTEEWDNMSSEEREIWWKNYLKEKEN